jgi:HEAT repeat protein
MNVLAWKLGTVAGAAASVYFALHPVRGGTPPRPHGGETDASVPATPAAHPSWLGLGWMLGGKPAAASESASGPLLAKLRAATSPEDICAALSELGEAGDEAATQAILGVLSTSTRSQVRTCAAEALGQVTSGEARSWLEELVHDRDPDVRATAIRALAAEDDPSAREVVLAVAREGAMKERTVAMIALAGAKVAQVTPLIVGALAGVDLATQKELVDALGASGDPAAVPAVAALAQSGGSTVREAAIDALGAIGGEASVGALAALLRSGRRDAIAPAAKALAQANTPAARQALFDALGGARRDLAGAALSALTSLDGPEVRAAMFDALSSDDHTTTALAGGWFGAHRDETAVPRLAVLARTGSAEVGEGAVAALAQIGGDGARDAIFDLAARTGKAQAAAIAQLGAVPSDPGAARALCVRLAREGGNEAAEAAMNVLGEDASPEARDALVAAARAGGLGAPQALALLAKRGDEASIGAVADVARASVGETRLRALEALGEAADPRATPTLVAALKEADPEVRRSALSALASVGGVDAERAIADYAATGPRDARLVATQSLVALGADSAAPLEQLAHDADPAVARAALEGLVTDAPDRAARVVADVAQADDAEARLAAVQATEHLDPAAASRILVAALRDRDPNVAQTAATQLGVVGTDEAAEALVAVLTGAAADVGSETQRAAADALANAGGPLAARYADTIARIRMTTPPEEEPTPDEPIEGEE